MSSYNNLKKKQEFIKEFYSIILFVYDGLIVQMEIREFEKIIIVIIYTNQCWKLALANADLKLQRNVVTPVLQSLSPF